MKKQNNTTQWLPAAGITLALGLAFWGWTDSSKKVTAESGSPVSSQGSSSGFGPGDNRESLPENAAISSRPDLDFASRAKALKEKTQSQNGKDKTYDSQIRQLLTEWAQSDPEAALSFALSPTRDGINEAFFQAADSALTVWAQKEPENAKAYLEHLSENPQMVAELAPAMMRTYAELSLPKAQEWVQSGFASDSGELRPVLAKELVSIMVEKGRSGDVEKWLANKQVAESAYALPAVSEYSRLLATKDIKAALTFSQNLPRGTMSRGIALQNAVQVWTTRDADKSYDWITGKTALDQTHPELFAGSGKKAPIPAGAYTSDELDYAISGYVLALAPTSRKEAMESAASIQNPSLRKRIQQQVSAMNPPRSSETGS